MNSTALNKDATDFPAISRHQLEVLQVNLGYVCNLSCTHCHVNAGPKRTESMSRDTVEEILGFIDQAGIKTLDLTGGAPEMNPHFTYLVIQAAKMQVKVIDRCNLVILEEQGYEEMAEFLADHEVEVIASLPCYLEANVDKQRGKGTFKASLAALSRLNALGYGQPESILQLNLVFNPQGINLPPEQSGLEKVYKDYLFNQYGIVFNRLFALANLPIQRFSKFLVSNNLFDEYMQLLKSNHQSENLEQVMCRRTLSIDWQGYVYDCDFNQMLALPLGASLQSKTHIKQLISTHLTGQPITVRDHCFGCTAGQGSSCTGALQ